MGWFDKFRKKTLSPVSTGGWRSIISEPFQGAWQQGKSVSREDISSFFAVFACISKISQDISKLPLLTKTQKDGVWTSGEVKGFDFLKKPNHYQTWQQFLENWLNSKLFSGNAYIFIDKDMRGNIKGFYVLNSERVMPLVDDSGGVYYQIKRDNLNNVNVENTTLPSEYIIHDRWNCFYHPLVGLPPIVACSVASENGLQIQRTSNRFFKNRAMPSGVLTAPGHIDEESAKSLKSRWKEAHGGEEIGGTAVLGDDLKYQPIAMTAVDAQLIEQLRLSAEIVCSTLKMPPFLIGFGALPNGMKVSDLNELYYSSCLQTLIEAIENLLTTATGAAEKGVSVEFDLESLIRMDAMTQIEILEKGVSAGLLKIDEGREKLGRGKVVGGDTPYLQQQNYSLAALAKRDAQENPFTNNPQGMTAEQAAKHLSKLLEVAA